MPAVAWVQAALWPAEDKATCTRQTAGTLARLSPTAEPPAQSSDVARSKDSPLGHRPKPLTLAPPAQNTDIICPPPLARDPGPDRERGSAPPPRYADRPRGDAVCPSPRGPHPPPPEPGPRPRREANGNQHSRNGTVRYANHAHAHAMHQHGTSLHGRLQECLHSLPSGQRPAPC